MEKEIADKNFVLWNQALETGDPKAVALLYDEKATFLPTFSSEFKKGRKGVAEYFEHFLKKKPIGEIIEGEVQFLNADCYLHSGLYNFEVGLEDKREIIEARFSFVWKKDPKGDWKILHHHSSVKQGK